jgi:hypothetical protein
MEKLIKKASAFQQGERLTREEMKNVTGGTSIPICFRCCPDDPCSPIRHVCPLVLCGEI